MTSQIEMLQLVLFRESMRKQLEEYEMLQSIYSMPGEFTSDNPFLVDDIRSFLSGHRSTISEKLDFRIKIQVTETVKMELSVMLGQLYPTHESPMFTIRTDTLTKSQEKLVERAIEQYIQTEVDRSDPYIFQVISWLQDNLDDVVKTEKPDDTRKEEEDAVTKLERAWFWSHHIYSKIKRQNIVKLCKNHELSGFMWPGKPGVICIEGLADNVDEVVRVIKSWQWQKLKIVKVESGTGGDFLRFTGFEEILTGTGDDGGDVKMDSGRFFKYLDAHQSGNMKMELFGFE